jgi:hypothetical protein
VLVCEGPTDAAAALSMGYSVVGRPQAQGCLDWLVDVLAGHHTIIVADDDGVGQMGARTLAAELFERCPRIQLYTPVGKDLRVMYAAEGETFIRDAISQACAFSYGDMLEVRDEH